MENQPGGQTPIQRTVDLASEYVVPGGSNFVRGDIVQGGIHLVLGFVAKVVWGFPGLFIVQADSIVKARTGQHIYDHLGRALAPTIAKVSHPRDDTNVV